MADAREPRRRDEHEPTVTDRARLDTARREVSAAVADWFSPEDAIHDDVEPHYVVAGLLRRGVEFFLCHRHPDRRWYPDVWDLPGGHVEHGENLADALVRELFEELGIRIDFPSTEPDIVVNIEDENLSLSIWVIDRWTGDPTNQAPEEHDDMRWFSEPELRDVVLAYPAIAEICHRLGRAVIE